MLKLITRTNVNDDWWNNTVDNCINGNVCIYTWYLDIVCGRNWWAIIDEEREIIMPLPIREKMGITYVYQPKFIQQLGIFSTKEITSEIVQECIECIPKQVKWVHFNLNRSNLIKEQDQIQEFQTNVILSMAGEMEKIRDNYRMNTKRNVRKAFSHALVLDKEFDENKTIQLFQKNRGAELEVFDDGDYSMFKKIIDAARAKLKLTSWGVSVGGVVAAGALFIESHGRYVFLFSGQNDVGRANQALTYLIDQFIESHINQEMILDFEGSSNPDLARYYKGFGGVEEKYITCKINRLPWYMAFLKK
jgi:hypothetical protein